jgi:hypothetical protein
LKRPLPLDRQERREIIALKRAGLPRESIAEKLGVPIEDVLRIIGPENEPPDSRRPLTGSWRRPGRGTAADGGR